MVSVVLPLIVPDVAVIVVLPEATPVARPELLMVAMVLSLDDQDTEEVMTEVVLFEYVAVAVNCCV